jgi:YVTN family beta-propeller protein
VNSWNGGPISIAANASATEVYVANSTANAVNVFQYNYNGTSTYGVTTTITTGSYPDALLLVPNSTTLYAANANDNTISVIDTSSKTVVNKISLPSAGHPNGLALTPDGSTLMVMNSPAGGITYIQVSSNTVINSLALGSNLEQAYITSDGANAYVTDYAANTIYQLSSVVTIVSVSPSAINNTNNNVSTITWSSTMSGTYEAEIGGNGTMGSGTALPGGSGSITAGQQLTLPVYASDLINLAGGANGPYTIYIYVKTAGGVTAYASTNIILLTTAPQPASNLSATPNDSKAYLSWTASPSPYIGGYTVYYSTASFDVNTLPSTFYTTTATSYTLNGLTNGTLYYIGVVAYDLAKNNSALSNITSVTPVHIPSPSELAGQKGNCFIATAAYGSYDQFDVWVLRQFRNHVLLRNGAGRWFVKTYYETSPPIAHFIAGHDALRAMVRVMLKPFVFGSMVVLYGTTVQKVLTLFLFIVIFGIAIAGIEQRKIFLLCHSRENGNPDSCHSRENGNP